MVITDFELAHSKYSQIGQTQTRHAIVEDPGLRKKNAFAAGSAYRFVRYPQALQWVGGDASVNPLTSRPVMIMIAVFAATAVRSYALKVQLWCILDYRSGTKLFKTASVIKYC